MTILHEQTSIFHEGMAIRRERTSIRREKTSNVQEKAPIFHEGTSSRWERMAILRERRALGRLHSWPDCQRMGLDSMNCSARSKDTADIILPKKESCGTCHSPRGGAADSGVTCHKHHKPK